MPQVQHLALVRDTTRVDAHDLTKVAAALQSQVLEDFTPAWRRPATVDAFLQLEDVPLSHWPMIVRDDIPYDAQGIHLDKGGIPFSLIRWDEGWSLTASHECLEMLADPYGDRLRSAPSPKSGQGQVRFLVEVCDPSEAAPFAYKKNGITVSDFYFSSYFGTRKSSNGYSFTGAITKPRQVLEGGYVSWRTRDGHWWQQTWFEGPKPKFRDLSAKPKDTTAREFTDAQTVVPKRFMKVRNGRTTERANQDDLALVASAASPDQRANDLRARVRAIARL